MDQSDAEAHSPTPLAPRLAWLPRPLRAAASSGLVTGSALLLVSTTIVNLGNYLFNLILGRWLGPADFADLSLIVTFMLVLTLITATLQTVVAKFSAAYSAEEEIGRIAGLRGWSVKWAWVAGALMAAALILGATPLQRFFHTASTWPFVLLGVGIPIYFVQGVDRGILQGQLRFLLLSASYQAEMWARLIVGIGLVALGWSVNGAVAALTLSFVATWLVARLGARDLPAGVVYRPADQREALLFAGPVSLALIGQILINNSDVLIVKHFFPPVDAGHYAALALIGRIVFFATWSVVTVLLPAVAQRHQKGLPHRRYLWLSLAAVLAVSVGVTGGAFLFPGLIVGILFGSAYLSIAPLLGLYAVATTLYSLANVVITYRLSIGNGQGGSLAVIGGAAQVVALWFLHSSLQEVVVVQIALMSGLLVALLGWDWWMERMRG